MRRKYPLFEEKGKYLIAPMSRSMLVHISQFQSRQSFPPPPAHLSGSNMVHKGILKAEQGGFRTLHGTFDSIFTLKMLIDKYVKSKPQKHRNLLFSCFVDFRKAFDYIPRQKLVDKLNKEGVHGRFLDVLMFMYSTDKSEVKIDDKLTQSFICKRKVPYCHLLFSISIGRTINSCHYGYVFPG